MYNSFMYIIDNEGIDTSYAYPYQGSVSPVPVKIKKMPLNIEMCLRRVINPEYLRF